jgi:predicted alpha/beta hydrolase family esterase
MRVILVHGFNASPEMNFHPWLARELRAKGLDVVAPTLPLKGGEELDLPAVMAEMKRQVGFLTADDILVGHSLGAFIVLQYMEAVEMTESPRAVVMVAAPYKVSRPELRRLFLVDLDADVAMWKAREFYVVHAKDDRLVPVEHGRRLAALLKARLVETDAGGHFMDAEYPVLLETVAGIATTPFEYAPGMSLPNDYENKAWADRIAPPTSKPEWMT